MSTEGNGHGRDCSLNQKIRVLMVVDSFYWVIGNFAHQVTKNNMWIDPFICSHFVFRRFVKRFGYFPMNFDVVHFLTQQSMKPFLGKLPIVMTLHHVDSSTKMDCFDESDAIMTVSQQWYDHLLTLGVSTERLGMVPFGVDVSQFHPPTDQERSTVRDELHIKKTDFVIGFAANRLSDKDGRKGVGCFIRAVRDVQRKLPNLLTLIIGPGWKNLVTHLRKENIRCLHIPYQVDHREIAKLYQGIDVFWMTSRIEGGPVPLIEAMASGIPCISTPVGAALDLIENSRNGFIVPFDSPEQYVELTLKLEGNEELSRKMRLEARRTIIQKRQWSNSIDCLKELYDKAAKNFKLQKPLRSAMNTDAAGMEVTHIDDFVNFQSLSMDVLSPKIRNWMKACEYLRGVQWMLYLGEWKKVRHLLGLALKTAKFSPNLWWQAVCVVVRGGRKMLFSCKYRSRGNPIETSCNEVTNRVA